MYNWNGEFTSLCLHPFQLDLGVRTYWQELKGTWERFVDYTGETVCTGENGHVTHDLTKQRGVISLQQAGVALLKRMCGVTYPGGRDLYKDTQTGEWRSLNPHHYVPALREMRDHIMTTFTLTIDNMMKMLAVFNRVRCGMPVVIMGETGCGKTYSIQYLATFLDVPFYKLDVHGGLTREDIIEFMTEKNGPINVAQRSIDNADKVRQEAKNPYESQASAAAVWVFFDEVIALGLIM